MALIESTARQWSAAQARRIVETARAAPTWGVSWYIGLHRRTVRVYERSSAGQLCAERYLARGAVITNARLAIRTSCWTVRTRFITDPDQPDLLAELTADENLSPTRADAGRYAALLGMRRDPQTIVDSIEAVHAVLTASWCDGVAVRALPPCETTPGLAAALATVDDRPDGSPMFLVLTVDDGRIDRIRAGCAAQSVTLTARALGLPDHPPVALPSVPGLRIELIERLTLGGFPQALLRIDTDAVLHERNDHE